jgi:hypothetical protein
MTHAIRWCALPIVAFVIGGLCMAAFWQGSLEIVTAVSEQWSPNRSWGIRMCKTCTSTTGVKAWLEIMDSGGIIRSMVNLPGLSSGCYDDCSEPDNAYNYIVISDTQAEIGEILGNGRVAIAITLIKTDVLEKFEPLNRKIKVRPAE